MSNGMITYKMTGFHGLNGTKSSKPSGFICNIEAKPGGLTSKKGKPPK